MSGEARRIQKMSAHTGPLPGAVPAREEQVAKLIDVTTCIGCRACEVACVEWNDLQFGYTEFQNNLQTMPDTRSDYWTLITMNEVANPDGTLSWLLRKHGCMHCVDPGCLAACPAEGAIVQYANGIVDFQQEYCIGCQYCVIGCPFNIPKFSPQSKRVFKCTLCSDRVGQGLIPACIKACPTGCLKFGTKQEMKYEAEKRVAQLREHDGFEHAGVYDPSGVGGTGVIYVLHDIENPERYGGLPKDPRVPASVRFWKGPWKWLSNFALLGALFGFVAHYFWFGPKRDEPRGEGGPESASGMPHGEEK